MLGKVDFLGQGKQLVFTKNHWKQENISNSVRPGVLLLKHKLIYDALLDIIWHKKI